MKRIAFIYFIILAFLFGIAQIAVAQVTMDVNELTIDKLFHTEEYSQERMSRIQWHKDGDAYTVLEASGADCGGVNIVTYQSKTKKVLNTISAEKLIPSGYKVPLAIASYSWSGDFKKLLIFTNTKKVWRSNTKGDYWIYNIADESLFQIGKRLPLSSLMFAKFSPDNASIAYVSNFNLYIENLTTNEITKLTTDGNGDIINGTFDWVYEEEFSCRDGFRWSANGKYIAYWQLNASDIQTFYMINNTDSVYSQIVPVQYPKVGQNPSSCKVGIIDLSNKETTWVKVPGDPYQNYIPRIQWIKEKLLITQLNRKQNRFQLWLGEANSAETELFYSEKEDTWIDILNTDVSQPSFEMTDMPVVDNGNSIIRMTEKDGWRHIYKLSFTDKSETLLTKGYYDVGCIYGVNVKTQVVYASASPENSTQRYLYAVSLDGKSPVKRITPHEYSGINGYNISPKGSYAFHSHSNTTTVPTTRLISLSNHNTIETIIDNKVYGERVNALNLPTYEFFKVTTMDGVELDGKILKPVNFNSEKKYPVLFYVYGEPWTQTATDRWRFGWDNLLSQKGYVIITMDNRGTPCLKGKDWRKSIYKKIGVVNSRDQAMATKEILKWDFIDKDRIAVWGWSGGGSMTQNLMFRYPEIYKTGMSVAGVSNQLTYDNIYQERYMGLPSENIEAFVEGSPITYAKDLQGDLLLVHGTADDNVHYQNCELLIDELIKHNKQFQVMPYPNRTHGVSEGENTTRHLYTLLTNYLMQHIESGAK